MKQRIITALIWLPIVVAITWWGNIPFVLMMLGFLAVGIWETRAICAAKGRGGDIGLLLPLVLYLLVGFGSLLALRVIWPNPLLVLFGCLICWVTDSFAYFTGRAFGKHKLAPTISPKKTWEGAIGGTAFALLLLVPYAVKLLGMPAVPAFVCVFIGSVLGQIGDLLESKLKRWGGVKDSGNFFPGHGGVLDRLDSLMLACPAVLLMWYLFV
ncbi:MAG: phosphatidate cytidylyltransferase [Firmicutes bacterium]|nr:phosphatidate cytidylyltransferase [Bacillota bacterium]MBR6824289.1 phosphatidate cytidylyltransferase [Bacillota bacterium]MBR7113924.1 phosphatidate cytidylyltransferase [Bacillota bacterium]